ncbi:FAD-dependent oxidoreductase [Rhodococcus sp. NPDC058514]|uniref:FAD-dependent oxidoreductase n=1 Tax=unclassified Rhodococcus (in: high G+C Gram-positive bacteria) TaxID=192944 RepID=UPI00364A1EC5
MSTEATVIGGGVIGLTCALELARAGHDVTVLTADPIGGTTSAVAAAIWFPYQAAPADAVLRWSAESAAAFAALASDAAAGVALRTGTVLERSAPPDRWWTPAVSEYRVVPGDDLPPGVAGGVRCTVPVIDMGRYLPWLAAQCGRAGVRVLRRRVGDLSEVDAELIVVAAGLGSAALTGDDPLIPLRGQVVRLGNPGLTDWLIDDDNPAGITYVVPRFEDVVCGGTADLGSFDTAIDPDTERAILERCYALMPELRGAPILSRGVGLRPTRPSVRLEAIPGQRRIICCYGHGGAGVTLSWGCAREVAALAG